MSSFPPEWHEQYHQHLSAMAKAMGVLRALVNANRVPEYAKSFAQEAIDQYDAAQRAMAAIEASSKSEYEQALGRLQQSGVIVHRAES